MRTIQDYRTIYRGIALDLGLRGDSVEVLIQLLANATYISEVENIVYAQESSLDRSTLVNSKIQHSMDLMYSVYRGACPRVILNVKPTKYLSFLPGDVLVTSNNFRVYYLGYWDQKTQGDDKTLLGGFNYEQVELSPVENAEDSTPLIGLIAAETYTLSGSLTVENPFYIETLENDLSNDIIVSSVNNGNSTIIKSTRQFSEHILGLKNDMGKMEYPVFDLTLPNYGSRLYFMNGSPTQEYQALYYRYSTLDSYNQAELKKMVVRGAELVSFEQEDRANWVFKSDDELTTGIITLEEAARDSMASIHYRANRERFLSSVMRSNSDLGVLLEETYPNLVKTGGTTYRFNHYPSTGKSSLNLWYVPFNVATPLSNEDKNNFIKDRRAYYVANDFTIEEGRRLNATMFFSIELYSGVDSSDLSSKVDEILGAYKKKFDIDLGSVTDEIKSLVSKISCVRSIQELTIDITDPSTGEIVDPNSYGDPYYFDISYNISTKIQNKL